LDCCRALGLLPEAVELVPEGSVYRVAVRWPDEVAELVQAPLSLTGEQIRADRRMSYGGLVSTPLELSEASREPGGHGVKQALSRGESLETTPPSPPGATNGIIPRERRPLWLYSGSLRFSRSSWTTQLTEQRLCLLEVHGVEAFGEPIIDTGKHNAPLVAAASLA